MIRKYGDVEISVVNEPQYSVNSTDNIRQYDYEYSRTSFTEHRAAAHGLNTRRHDQIVASAIVLGVGGATGVHENSIAHDGTNIYVAAGDSVCSLSFPRLKLNWLKKVDIATCFGVYWLQHYNCVLTWGEVMIGCFSPDGEEQWSTSGPDIFTQNLELTDQFAVVTDFNCDVFSIRLSNGSIASGGL